MHKFFVAAVAAVVAIETLAVPTEAAQVYRSNGWHVVKSAQRSVTVTLRDRTPTRTYVYVSWAKKPGTNFCRARVKFYAFVSEALQSVTDKNWRRARVAA